MSNAMWFNVAMRCRFCGRITEAHESEMNSYGLSSQYGDEWCKPGDLIIIPDENFDDACIRIRAQQPGEKIGLVELWTCARCGKSDWAKISFIQNGKDWYQFSGAEAVELTPNVMTSVHYISRYYSEDIRIDIERLRKD